MWSHLEWPSKSGMQIEPERCERIWWFHHIKSTCLSLGLVNDTSPLFLFDNLMNTGIFLYTEAVFTRAVSLIFFCPQKQFVSHMLTLIHVMTSHLSEEILKLCESHNCLLSCSFIFLYRRQSFIDSSESPAGYHSDWLFLWWTTVLVFEHLFSWENQLICSRM